MFLFALVMVFLVFLALSVAAPTIARSIQRDRELESEHRAQQYVRAIRIFYLKFNHYPTSLEQLEKTNNQRFLRQRYADPLTGKDDWRIIHVGENQTTVKGFFGDDLPGLPSGLGSAAGLTSSTGSSAFGNSGTNSPGGPTSGTGNIGGTSAFGGGNSTGSAFGGSSPAGAAGAPGGTGTSAFGQSGSSGGPGIGGTAGGTTTGTNGIASQDATTFGGSSAGPMMGIGSAKSGQAMLVVNEQTTYDTWEFLYDPRIEQLYAKSTLLGGISSGSGTGSGFGTSSGTTGTGNGFGNPSSLGFGGSNAPGAGNGTGNTNGNPGAFGAPSTPNPPGSNPTPP